jgi:Fic-DOC domain mobile mystery protein B
LGAVTHSYTQGATPIDADEAAGLIPTHIRTQAQLNQWEEENILEAEAWALHSAHADVLSEAFVRKLHRAMFNKTWRWAGKFRRSDKNIGVDFTQIATRLNQLLQNVKTQIDHKPDDFVNIVARFHHQLVWIHAFPNGNGRHARLHTDVLLRQLGHAPFTWGGINLVDASATRQAYLSALRAADLRDFAPLLAFVQS